MRGKRLSAILAAAIGVSLYGYSVVYAEISTKPDLQKITVANNVGKSDTVTITGITKDDTVTIYAPDKVTVLGKAKSKGESVTVSLSKQLAYEKIDVSVTKPKYTESEKVEVNVPLEQKTAPLEAGRVKVTNNAGKNDIVTIEGLKAKETVKVYKIDGKTLLGSGKLSKDGNLVISLSKQLVEDKVLVSLTQDNKQESEKISVAVLPEEKSKSLLESNIIIVNNVSDDKIIVLGVKEGSTVRVYSKEDKSKAIASGKVDKGQKLTVLNVKQLGKESGKLYISVSEDGKQESEIISKTFDKE